MGERAHKAQRIHTCFRATNALSGVAGVGGWVGGGTLEAREALLQRKGGGEGHTKGTWRRIGSCTTMTMASEKVISASEERGDVAVRGDRAGRGFPARPPSLGGRGDGDERGNAWPSSKQAAATA